MIVNDVEGPGQPFAVALTVIVAMIGALVVLTAVNAPIFPEPFVPKPISDVLDQVNTAPLTLLVKLIAPDAAELQKTLSVTTFTTGVGFTVIVTVTGVPGQPFAAGIISYRTVPGIEPVAIRDCAILDPFPPVAPETPV